MTALKSASRSVSESPRTCTIWCPAGGACGAAWDAGGAGCPGPGVGPCPWGGCAGGCPWPWGACWGCGCCPGSMASASRDAHPLARRRGLRPDAPARRAETRESARAALGGGSGAILALRTGGLRRGPASPAPAPPPPPCAPAPLVWRLRLGRGCEKLGPAAPENFFPSTPLTEAGQPVAFPLPLSLLFPFLVPSFLSFFFPAAAAPD